MQVPIHAAKTNLSKLIQAALDGEEVVIARGTTPVVRLVPVAQSGFRFGGLPAEVGANMPDFLESMSEEDRALWEGRG